MGLCKFTLSTDLHNFVQDLNLSTERLTANKAFTNKLWNAGKFLLQNLPNQNDASAWENILAYKVFSCSLSFDEVIEIIL